MVELPSAPGGHEGELLFHLAPADDASRGGDALRYAWFAAPGVYHGEAGARWKSSSPSCPPGVLGSSTTEGLPRASAASADPAGSE